MLARLVVAAVLGATAGCTLLFDDGPDNNCVPSDEVNSAPQVSAGSNQTIDPLSSAALAGSATDDGQPCSGSLSTTWTKVSGPGTVNFADGSDATTGVTFSSAGTYRLRFSADDSELSSDAEVTVTVRFAAYNDMAWGIDQLSNKITTFTSPNGASGLPTAGELIDFASGLATGVTLTVTGGAFVGEAQAVHGAEPLPGTDAHGVFDGIVSVLGACSYTVDPNSPLVMTLTGLDPASRYDLVFHSQRNAYDWDRASSVRLVGSTAFRNKSTKAQDNPAETDGSIFGGPEDDATRLPSLNSLGYVARFVAIDPGGDGEVALHVEWDGTLGNENLGKYASALQLRLEPDCNDLVLNGDESDVDCGGPRCDRCVESQACGTAPDCQSSICMGSVCQASD